MQTSKVMDSRRRWILALSLPWVLGQPALSQTVSTRVRPYYRLTAIEQPQAQPVFSDLNNAGEAVGNIFFNQGMSSPFLFAQQTLIDLSPLLGAASFVVGINDAGQMVGRLQGEVEQHAFLYSNGTLTDLGTLGGPTSTGRGINNASQVTGSASTKDGYTHAFLYGNDGTMIDLGTLGGHNSIGYGINNAGDVVGESSVVGDTASRAFLYRNGEMRDLGTFGGDSSRAFDINDAGWVTGWARTQDALQHAFIYSDDRGMIDLGTLGGSLSIGLGINKPGQVVGTSRLTADSASGRAFLYSDGRMWNLNDLIDPSDPLAPYVTLVQAVHINDRGWIIASGIDNRPNTGNRAYLLTRSHPRAARGVN